ncbi:hypothetical protein BDP27DRAFT_1424891 [Rhodocollybia butyracea]|uniref:Uncharacterized protein n=1 Tax=Rhodocollybia butyracea TaxID=206335 RepID=A0A9P5PLD8_9AGAR|nr:hypothetical protein BDP27DRAFT_1424891 [Rhodocollybia butyracea]
MFFTRHSLGLALLAFLISPACAAPALERREAGTTYTVGALRVNGDPIPMPPQALKNIKASVSAMFPWKKGKKYLPSFLDSSDRIKYEGPMDTRKFDAAKMFYYELEGGVLGAPPTRNATDMSSPQRRRKLRRHTILAPFPGAWINLRLPRNTSAPAWKPWLGGPAIDLNFVVTAPNTVVPVGGIVIPPSNVVSDGMVVAHGWALPYGYDCTVTRIGWAGPPPGLKAFRCKPDATPAADADVGESHEILGNTLEISDLRTKDGGMENPGLISLLLSPS